MHTTDSLQSTQTVPQTIAHIRDLVSGADGLESPLGAYAEHGDISPLLTWAEEHGESLGESGTSLQAAIDEALSISKELKLTAVLDGIASSHEQEKDIESAFVAATVAGFMTGARQERDDHGRVDYLRDRVAELTALHRVISAANSSIKLSDMLQETAQAVVAVTRADVCTIFLYDPERDQLVLTATSDPASTAVGTVRLQLGESITGLAAMAGAPIAVRNAHTDPRFRYLGAMNEDRAVSILAVPVVLFSVVKLVGVITVRTVQERDFSDNEIKFLETVAGEIAIAIENARLYEQTDARLRQKVAELTTLQGVSAHIASTLNLTAVLSLIAHQAAHLVQADAASIYELSPDSSTLDQVAQYNLEDVDHNLLSTGTTASTYKSNVRLDVEVSTIARAVLTGEPTNLPADADAALGTGIDAGRYRSMICVPLVAPRGIMGGICLYDAKERTFSDEQVHLLDAFAHEAAIALENSRLYEAAVRGLEIKSAMLQEMNHRVRNNMQTVAGLLSMQLRRMSPDSEAATAMRESIGRIQSMAAVHDLMVGRDIVSTTVYDLIKQVAEAAVSTLTKPDFNLDLVIEKEHAEEIRVGSHEATLLALLLNELVSNAILHGFAGLEKGKIKIRAWMTNGERGDSSSSAAATRRAQPTVNIEIADNGCGLPEDFSPERNANLGLNIVRTMIVSDLRGSFELKPGPRGKGTVARISFKPSQG